MRVASLLNKAFSLPGDGQVSYPESDGEWASLLEVAEVHGMLGPLFRMSQQLPEPQRPKGKRIMRAYFSSEMIERDYRVRLDVMQRLAALFQSKGLDVLFMKGATLSQRYPWPSLRYFSDIDYYLYGRAAEGVDALASAGIGSSEYYHHHTQSEWEGILLENHYDFLDRENHRCNLKLDDALKSLAETEGRSCPFEAEGFSGPNAYRMTPTMEAVFLMRHMSAHFVASGIALRQLYDWVLFLHHDTDKVDWERVSALFEEAGLSRFAGMVSWLMQEKLRLAVVCPILPEEGKTAEKIWADIANPSGINPHRKGTLRYYASEAVIFLKNRWKHRIVYPGESYTMLMFNYLRLKVKLGR